MNRRRPTRHRDARTSRSTGQPGVAASYDDNGNPSGDAGPDSASSCPAPDTAGPVDTGGSCDVSVS